jgi:plastocyanin
MNKAFRISFICSGLVMLALALNSCSSPNEKPKTYTVEIKDMKFVPDTVTVNKGDTILWLNKDMVAHDVTEQGSKAWSSSIIPAGQSWKMAVADGADYYCSIHVVMKGKIEIK